MNIEAKPRTLITVGIIIAFLVAGYFYIKKTAPERAYKAELRKLRIIEEHQRLEIEVTKQRAILDAMKKAAEDAVPKYTLTPEQKQDRKERHDNRDAQLQQNNEGARE